MDLTGLILVSMPTVLDERFYKSVIYLCAHSEDGYMGINSETQTWITGVDVNKFAHKLRSTVDAIIIGRNTALVDNPRLTVREVLGNNPIRIIADTYRKLPLTLKLFNDNSSNSRVIMMLSRHQ